MDVLAIQGPAQIVADFRVNWPIYLSMPFVAALIGYGTKIVAIEMMFKPVKFRGIKPFLGWQGIIPRRSARMAGILCDTLTSRLISAEEIVDRLDADRIAAEIDEPLRQGLRQVAEQMAAKYQPQLWESLPVRVRRMVIARIENETPAIVNGLVGDIKQNIEAVFDLKQMVISSLVKDKLLVEKLFRDVGKKEFAFIRRSGLYFGFTIGLVQMVAWAVLHNPLVMPVFGLFTGWLTDWLALKMIFEPKEPKRYFGLMTWQGLFLKRRLEVSEDYGKLIADEILTPTNLIEELLQGPLSDQLITLIDKQVQRALDEQTGIARPLVVFAVGGRQYQELKKDVSNEVMRRLPDTLKHVERYAGDAMLIQQTLIEKMRAMTPEEFEGVLRPAFQQDEWILITVGAVLGFLVGELQVVLVEHLAVPV